MLCVTNKYSRVFMFAGTSTTSPKALVTVNERSQQQRCVWQNFLRLALSKSRINIWNFRCSMNRITWDLLWLHFATRARKLLKIKSMSRFSSWQSTWSAQQSSSVSPKQDSNSTSLPKELLQHWPHLSQHDSESELFLDVLKTNVALKVSLCSLLTLVSCQTSFCKMTLNSCSSLLSSAPKKVTQNSCKPLSYSTSIQITFNRIQLLQGSSKP